MLNNKASVTEQIFTVNKSDRNKLNGHKGKVLWLTGLSGSGKSTIANS
jgi:bifunctional enzyme CysN/CysC